MVQRISRSELSSAAEQGKVVIVDALPPAPFAARHLPGAVNLTAEDLQQGGAANATEVLPDRQATVVTYSTDANCARGPELAIQLEQLGYGNVHLYTEGIQDWVAAGLPVETG